MKKQLTVFFLFTCLGTKVIGQAIDIRLGVRDSLQSVRLNENRKFVTYLPPGYDTSRNTYAVLYLLDGTIERLEFFSSMLKMYFKENLIVVAIPNTNRDRDMMPLNAPSYPVAKPGADNFLSFIRDELIPEIESKNRTSHKRILCGQSLSAVFALYVFLKEPKLFDSYLANSVGWYSDMDYFFSPLVQKAFQKPQAFDGKTLFLANSENDGYDPRKEVLKSIDGFSMEVDQKLGKRLKYKYEIYSKYGHSPYPAFYDGMKFILADHKGN